ncbi:hypothetical protein NDU88_010802 [Pleurodeles waltl]|uniref:Uncharacterized protein n=1 Tax=Pleurodeles waltl TaxID=8319 RepID=A0AAV7Q311_PLEWA|nr:hypothetical protein NDU88_010802 [Pleurodeles waltl]
MAIVGNPDIRVSQGVKVEDGQRTPREKNADGAVKEEESADGAVIEAGDADEQGNASRTIPEDRSLAKEVTSTPRVGPTEGQRSPEQQRLRHVPGGTWLKQHLSLTKFALLFIIMSIKANYEGAG